MAWLSFKRTTTGLVLLPADILAPIRLSAYLVMRVRATSLNLAAAFRESSVGWTHNVRHSLQGLSYFQSTSFPFPPSTVYRVTIHSKFLDISYCGRMAFISQVLRTVSLYFISIVHLFSQTSNSPCFHLISITIYPPVLIEAT